MPDSPRRPYGPRARRFVTASELGTFASCPCQHDYRYNAGLVPIGPTPASMLIGTAVHTATEWLYKGNPFENCEIALHGVFTTFLRWNAANVDVQAYEQARDLATSIFRNYVSYWWGSDSLTARHPITGDLLVEHEFQVPVFTPVGKASSLFTLRGKVDRIIVHEGEFWVLDQKTRDSIDTSENEDGSPSLASDGSRLLLDLQARTYCWAERVYLGIPIAGVCYDLVRRKAPGVPHVNKDGTVSMQKCDTRPEILRELLVAQDAYLSSLSTEERKAKKLAAGIDFEKYDAELARLESVKWFDRYFQRYDNDDYRSVQLSLYQISKDLHQCEYAYQNDRACDHWSGCRYKPLCIGMDPEGMFAISKNTHPELQGNGFHLPLGKPFRIDREFKTSVDFRSIVQSVNP